MNLLKKLNVFLDRNRSGILTGVAVGGVISTAALASEAGKRASAILAEEAYRWKVADPSIVLTPRDKVVLTWKIWAPTVISGGLTIACIITSHKMSERRIAAFASAYSLLEYSLHEYQDKVIETIGKNKEAKIQTGIHEDYMRNNPVTNAEVFKTNAGDYLFFDPQSGRYFKSSIEKVESAINKLNNEMLTDMNKSLNDFYYEIGLPGTELGRQVGWSIDNGLIEVVPIAVIANTGEPCISLKFVQTPGVC